MRSMILVLVLAVLGLAGCRMQMETSGFRGSQSVDTRPVVVHLVSPPPAAPQPAVVTPVVQPAPAPRKYASEETETFERLESKDPDGKKRLNEVWRRKVEVEGDPALNPYPPSGGAAAPTPRPPFFTARPTREMTPADAEKHRTKPNHIPHEERWR